MSNAAIARKSSPNAETSARQRLQRCSHIWKDADTLILASASIVGKLHIVTADSCDCEAAQHGIACWHRSAFYLLQPITETLGGPRTVEEIDQAEVDAQLLERSSAAAQTTATLRQAGRLAVDAKRAETVRAHMATHRSADPSGRRVSDADLAAAAAFFD